MGGYDNSKTERYVTLVWKHVVKPLEDSQVGQSCFAAVMLIFAAVDGLGALLTETGAGNSERFKTFMRRYFPGKYGECIDDLWKLRNTLMHNALNVASFLSRVPENQIEHLSRLDEYLFVHTEELLRDFKEALDRFECDMQTDAGLFTQAESVLKEHNVSYTLKSPATPPPPVSIEYIRTKAPRGGTNGAAS